MIKPRRSRETERSDRKAVRCAIYTRKSTEEGLDQDFNSLDAQRESAEAYIRSQAHEGWRLVSTRYDDGGFSGGNRERPALAERKRIVRLLVRVVEYDAASEAVSMTFHAQDDAKTEETACQA